MFPTEILSEWRSVRGWLYTQEDSLFSLLVSIGSVPSSSRFRFDGGETGSDLADVTTASLSCAVLYNPAEGELPKSARNG